MRKIRKAIFTTLFITIISSHLLFSIQAYADQTLILGVHPYKSATTLSTAFSPLVDYLSKATGKNIQLKISKDYASHIDLIGKDKIDIAFMGPASYVKLTNIYDKKRLLARLEIKGKPTFQGMIITRSDSKINSLSNLENKRFAFGSPASTMSHLVPRYMMLEAGIPVSKLKKHAFLGNHDNVALSVLSGHYDAGAVKEAIYYKYQERGLKIVATTPPLSEHLFIASNKLDVSTYDQLKKTILHVNSTDKGMKILKKIKKTVTALVPVDDKDYDNLRKILNTLNLPDADKK